MAEDTIGKSIEKGNFIESKEFNMRVEREKAREGRISLTTSKRIILTIVVIALLMSLSFIIFQIYNPVIKGTVYDENKSPL